MVTCLNAFILKDSASSKSLAVILQLMQVFPYQKTLRSHLKVESTQSARSIFCWTRVSLHQMLPMIDATLVCKEEIHLKMENGTLVLSVCKTTISSMILNLRQATNSHHLFLTDQLVLVRRTKRTLSNKFITTRVMLVIRETHMICLTLLLLLLNHRK